MKTLNKIYIWGILAAGMVSCSQEAPFGDNSNDGIGRFLTSALSLDVREDKVTRVDEKGIPSANDFEVCFYDVKDTDRPVKKFESYGAMPEVVMLPAGEYFIEVKYEPAYESSSAGFNRAHYSGKTSENFTVKVDEIVDKIKPIECHLSNVRVSVNYDASLYSEMSADSYVNVKVGESGSLNFSKTEKRDGYFEYDEDSKTLVATFFGVVEGIKMEGENLKTFTDVQPGKYYNLTFKLNKTESSAPGNIETDNSSFSIEAVLEEIEIDNGTTDVFPEDDDPYIDDDLRPDNGDDPNQGGDEPGPDEPNNPDNPDTPDDPSKPGPVITGSDEVDLSGINDALSMTTCILYITAEAGIKEFIVTIDSPELVADLKDMANWEGDASVLDFIHPGEKEGFLSGLLEKEVGECLIGETYMEFDISSFLSMLESFSGIHKFNVKVTDLNGKSASVTLQLQIK